MGAPSCDINLVMDAVRQNGMALAYANEEFKDTLGVVMSAVRNNGMALKFASKGLRNMYGVVETAVSNNGMALEFASMEMQMNKTIVSKAVLSDPKALGIVLPCFKLDDDIVKAAIKTDHAAILLADKSYRYDKTRILSVIEANPYIYEFISENSQNDKEIAIAAAIPGLYLLSFSSLNKSPLLEDYDVVLAAVTADGTDLEHATNFQDNYKIVVAAVRSDGHAFRFASPRLRGDPNILAIALGTCVTARHYSTAGDLTCPSKTEVITAIEKGNFDDSDLNFIDRSLQLDRHVALKLVEHSPNFYFHLPLVRKCDVRVICHMMKLHAKTFIEEKRQIPRQKERDVVIAVLKQVPSHFPNSMFDPFRDDSEIGHIVVSRDGMMIRHLSTRLREDLKIVMAAIENNGLALQYVPDKFARDPSVVGAAVQQNGRAILFASHEFHRHDEFFGPKVPPEVMTFEEKLNQVMIV